MFLEYLKFDFIQNAIFASFFISILCAIIGPLILVNRLSSIVGGVAHAAYGGIGISLYFGISVIFSSLAFCIFCALIIAFLSKQKSNQDAVISVIWAFGMSIGLLLSDLSTNFNTAILNYLFGAILTVEKIDFYAMIIALIIIIPLVFIFYRQLVCVCADSEFAQIRNIKANLIYYLIVIFSAVCVVLGLRVVGLVMIIALISIPAYISLMFVKSLFCSMFLSAILSFLFCFCGLMISIIYNLSTSSCIILLACICFIIAYLFKKFIKLYNLS